VAAIRYSRSQRQPVHCRHVHQDPLYAGPGIACWPARAGRSFAEELGRTQWEIELASDNIAAFQAEIDCLGHKMGGHARRVRRQAIDSLARWRFRLDKARAQNANLALVRERGLSADLRLRSSGSTRRRRRGGRRCGRDRPTRWACWHGRFAPSWSRNDADAVRAGPADIADARVRLDGKAG
jgi:hypothetical protein